MFRTIFYLLTAVVVIAQLSTIFGNRILGDGAFHPITIWNVAPSLVLCVGILAILEAINKRKI